MSRLCVRMLRCLIETQHRTHACVGAIEDRCPLVARPCAQDLSQTAFAVGPLCRIVAVSQRFRRHRKLGDEFLPERSLQCPNRQKPAIGALIHLVERCTGIRRVHARLGGTVPGSGTPVFQAAAANLNPWTEDRVNTRNPERGPLLLIAGEKDHTVPLAVVAAEYKLQQRNPSLTEFREIPGRGHSLTIDHGWREIAEIALAFIAQQFS